MKINKWLIIPSVFALSITAYGQNEIANSQQTITQKATELPEPGTAEYNQAYKAMGYAMAQQVGASGQMNFTEEEASFIAEGFLSSAKGEKKFEGYDESTAIAKKLYDQRRKEIRDAYEAKKQQKIDELMKSNKEEAKIFFDKLVAEKTDIQKTKSGLYYEIIEMGDAENKPTNRDNVTVHYEGTLTDGTVFDSSYDRGTPATFSTKGVVPGFSEGLKLIGKGGKVKLYMHTYLAYEENPPRGSIIEPGDALIFTVELLDIKPQPAKAPRKSAPKSMPNMKTPPPAPPTTTPPPPPSGPPPSRVSE